MKKDLKKMRNEANLSQYQLARKLNVTPNTIHNWESGLSDPSLENAYNMAKMFGVTTDDIFLSLKTTNVVKQ